MQTIYVKGKKEGRVVATDFTEDRDGEKIDVSGLELKDFKKNPIMLFGHNHMDLPIGTAKNIKLEGKRLTFEPVLSTATQFARDVKALWDEGVLKAVSIGFIPKEREKNIFTKSELLEISIVNVPANPNALADAKAKGLNLDVLKEVPGNSKLEKASKESEWDSSAAERRVRKWATADDKVDFEQYKQAFAWRDEEDSKNFSSYKLQFADVIEGELKAVWKGVVAAQSALLGGRGGVSGIPENERRQIHNLLGKYYERFNEKQPEFAEPKSIDEVIGLVEKGLLTEDVGYAFIAGLHRASEKSQGETSAPKGEVDAEAALLDAMHLSMQQIAKTCFKTLETANHVRGKKRKEKS